MAMFNNQRVFQWDDCFLGETLRPGLPNKVLALRTEGQRHPERSASREPPGRLFEEDFWVQVMQKYGDCHAGWGPQT